MKVLLDRNFLKSAKFLPKEIKVKLAKLLALLEVNPYDPLLHTKKLTGKLVGLLSFRITRDWRVIFYFEDPKTIQILDVENRKDIYR